jgi:hypothetical protein
MKAVTGEFYSQSLSMKKINKIRVRNLGLYTFIYIGVTLK